MDRSDGDYRPFVQVKIAGQPVKLLIDTGAFQSVLPMELARARHLRTATQGHDQTMVDADGDRVVAKLLPAVPVQFESEAFGGTLDFLAVPGLKLEGVLAPSDLVRPGWAVVLDLEHDELSYEPEGEAVKRGGGAGPQVRTMEFRSCVHEGFFNRVHRFVATTVQGTPANMMIDTGAMRTVLTRNNPAIPAMKDMLGERGGIVAMTSTGKALIVDGVQVEFAGILFPVSALVVPVSDPCSGGAIGSDVLQHCTIVWGHASMWASCRAPGEGP